MTKILLLQLDGKLPNLALMRIAAHHRARGDEVVLRFAPTQQSVERQLGDNFACVYASCIFERSRPIAEQLRRVYPDAIIGGTGWNYTTSLEGIGITGVPDYSIYPNYHHSIGFTQRGCRLKCEFCVVPKKEGSVKETASIMDIWRGDPYPRNILLLDNDFFGQPRWRDRIKEIRDGGFKVSFNQGINARMISDEAAEAIASVMYRDDSFKNPRLYTAWDSLGDEEVLFRGLNRLVAAGIRPDNIMVYMLIGYWPGEKETDWLYRQQKLRDFGARPYPMPYHRTPLTIGFQRWCVRRTDLVISWEEYRAANCQPAKVKKRRQAFSLPLFDAQGGDKVDRDADQGR